jgi:hypothetical protein
LEFRSLLICEALQLGGFDARQVQGLLDVPGECFHWVSGCPYLEEVACPFLDRRNETVPGRQLVNHFLRLWLEDELEPSENSDAPTEVAIAVELLR